MPDFPDIDGGGEVLTESETKLEKPKLFKVLLHNDDFTTMEFVVFVLQYVFNRDEAEAFTIMLKVHNEGLGIAGIYPYEIANMKSRKGDEPRKGTGVSAAMHGRGRIAFLYILALLATGTLLHREPSQSRTLIRNSPKPKHEAWGFFQLRK